MHTLSTTCSCIPQRLVGVVALLVTVGLVAACDSTGGLDDSDDVTVSPEETAESLAFSLAEATGGTASDLADAAALANGVRLKAFDRSRECDVDTEAFVWTCTLAVSGSTARIDSAALNRTYRAQFFADGTAIREPSAADSMTFEVVEGSGTVQTARIDNAHTLLPALWSLGDLSDSTATINLLSDASGRDVREAFTGERRTRTREAEIRRTRAENLVWRRGDGLVDGIIEGAYDATVEIERADGSTVGRTVSVTYVATFSEDGGAITFTGGGGPFDGETFTFNPRTGDLQ